MTETDSKMQFSFPLSLEPTTIKALYIFASAFIVLFYMSGFFVCDDAQISFAVSENLFSGFGPVYTAGERVQVHTNPLWTGLLTVGRLATVDYGKISFVFSTLLMIGVLVAFWVWFNGYAFFAIVYLFASKVMFSFMGGGLENPLTYFLICVAMMAFDKQRYNLFIVVLSLIGINRIDTLVLFVPLIIWLVSHLGIKNAVKRGLLYGIPLWAFLIFTFVYYGFLFPNTYYAKIGSIQFSVVDRVGAGLSYYFGALQRAPIDLALLFFVLTTGFRANSSWKSRSFILGIALSGLYIIYIGGDQMFPRLLGVPVFASITHLLMAARNRPNRPFFVLSGALIFVLALVLPWTPIKTLEYIDKVAYGEANEVNNRNRFLKGIFIHDFQITWSINRIVSKRFDNVMHGRSNKYRDIRSFDFEGAAGMVGLQYGPHYKNFDCLGLTDPLLARIPSYEKQFSPGHNSRRIPLGYPETRIHGENRIKDKGLAHYHETLKLVTTGPIWTVARWKAIGDLNFNSYEFSPLDGENSLLEREYEKKLKKELAPCSFNKKLICPAES